MQYLLTCTVLLTAVLGIFAEGCPAGCQCNQPQTVFCLARRNPNFPRRVPRDTVSLYVFENGISSVEEGSFSGLNDLQLLDLSHNKLSSLPGGVFRNLANLSNLDLSSNQLAEISAETFQGLGRLERLYLNENRITSIHPDAFKGLENLLELKLRKNQLVTSPTFSLPNLLLLELSYNVIPAIQPGDFDAPNIETLRLAGLGLKEVPEELLTGLKNLHDLDLSDNQLDKVPSGLHGLTKLSLAGNAGISQLQVGDFSTLPGLQEVDLSGLSLHILPKGIFHSSLRLRSVSLAQNPFNCVCLLGWLAEWLRESGVVLLRPDETRCHFPPKNAGKTLGQLRDSEYGCPPPTTVIVPTTMAPTSTTGSLRPTKPLHAEMPTTAITTTTTTLSHNQQEEEHAPSTTFSYEDQQCPPNTCLNDGLCRLDPTGQLECECLLGFYGMYCEMGPVTPAVVTELNSVQLQVLEVTGSSIQVDLKSYSQNKNKLWGIRLTLRSLSGSDRRPVIINLHPTLSDYTVRGLTPNTTYWLCLGSQGEEGPEEEICTDTQTTGESPKHSAHITQSREGNLTLVLVPAVAAGVLLSVAVAAAACYARRRQGKGHTGEDGGPLEMEGVKIGLEGKGEIRKLTDVPTGPERGGGESDEPLMDPTKTGNNNGTHIGRLPHSYF
ncbi:vasorin [Rhinophrynus dorsalis]